jgi:hypothetical protein
VLGIIEEGGEAWDFLDASATTAFRQECSQRVAFVLQSRCSLVTQHIQNNGRRQMIHTYLNSGYERISNAW